MALLNFQTWFTSELLRTRWDKFATLYIANEYVAVAVAELVDYCSVSLALLLLCSYSMPTVGSWHATEAIWQCHFHGGHTSGNALLIAVFLII